MFVFATCAQARIIEDMTGREVEIPDTIQTIFPASPPVLYFLYALDSKKIAGLNFQFTAVEKGYLRKDFLELPVIGGWFGQGNTPNLENVMAVNPDFMLVWSWKQTALNQPMEETAEIINLPIVYLQLDTMEEYIRSFRFMGELLGCPERGNALADYTQQVLDGVRPVLQNLPEDEKLWVYYAEGPDGLKTECDQSPHAALIQMAGGRNIQHCVDSSTYGMETVSIEEVLDKNPEVILIRNKQFAEAIYKEKQWSLMRAVQNKRVYSIPAIPFNWFDRPPSFMRILGLQWLTNKLYPERYPKDMVKATREFYKLFLDVDLSDEDINSLLNP
ncbi:ABC transporter substrate-binding protein [Pseudodesulfovibrio sediminis]|uniref:ABC transporter substrate-binding protein n=1 Tax=Pseudodesulfovibrio sediminis TaxID=2810563 RepID=UPI001E3F5BEA|nr:ABC transporter substrate-binding protein [Pseudodesulfovibrio sediminis]